MTATTQPGITLDDLILKLERRDDIDEDDVMEILASLIRLKEIEAKLREPTKEMLCAARDWSLVKYGQGVGNDGAIGCWKAMSAILLRGKP